MVHRQSTETSRPQRTVACKGGSFHRSHHSGYLEEIQWSAHGWPQPDGRWQYGGQL